MNYLHDGAVSVVNVTTDFPSFALKSCMLGVGWCTAYKYTYIPMCSFSTRYLSLSLADVETFTEDV